MRKLNQLLLTITISLTCVSAWAQYSGGTNDGYSFGTFCGGDLNGGAPPALTLGAISGSSTFCSFGSDVYTVNLTSGTANTFTWSVPAGSVIVGAFNTLTSSTVSVNFGNTNGSITVVASNSCTTSASGAFPVTATTCNQFFGGTNDGYSSAIYCAIDLSGTISPGLTLSPITGSATFCGNGADLYTVSALTSVANTYYWTVPTNATVSAATNSLTTSFVNVNFGAINGTISVTASNGCTSDTKNLSVTGTTCDQYFGGNDDGYTSAAFCGSDLAGGAAAPITLNAINGSVNFCGNGSDLYTVNLATGSADFFSWTGPAGASIGQRNGTTTTSLVNLQFAAASGNVTVTASNSCSNDSKTLAVTVTTCDEYFGGNDDGFSVAAFCGSNLSGGAAAVIALNAISGATSICFDLGDNYSVTVAGGSPTQYSWSGPTGASPTSVLSTFSSSRASITFASTSGNVSVTASNACSSDTKILAVTGSACGTTLGGSNDGFSFGLFGVVLPIKLVSFNAKVVEQGIETDWVTETEINNNYFSVERSTDGVKFESIARINGAGNSTKPLSYSFIDTKPYRGISYYRLKQTDFNGTFEYSKIIRVEYIVFGDESDVLVYPNPAPGSNFNLRFNNSVEGTEAELQISDMAGKTISSQRVICNNPLTIQFPASQPMKSGMYLIIIQFNNKKVVNKLIVP